MNKPQYINWIVKEDGVVFEDNYPLFCFRLSYDINDNIFDDWALHIRRHYLTDDELIEGAALNELTVEEYLRKFIVPQKEEPLGSTARSNDISEILFSDLFQFVLNYEVPRCKQYNRSGKNNSEHGTDIIAYKYFDVANHQPNIKDKLVAIEVKARLTSKEACEAIKDAVTDSKKDEYRLSLTLDYYRKKLRSMGKDEEAKNIARFQQKVEKPYKTLYVGAAMTSLPSVGNHVIVGIKGSDLELKTGQYVFYVHGNDLMSLAHKVFERCKK